MSGILTVFTLKNEIDFYPSSAGGYRRGLKRTDLSKKTNAVKAPFSFQTKRIETGLFVF